MTSVVACVEPGVIGANEPSRLMTIGSWIAVAMIRSPPLQLPQAIAARHERGRPCRNASRRRECVAVGALRAEIDADGCNWGQLVFLRA
jgi:hypothetical protein